MKCPVCDFNETKVHDSRTSSDDSIVRRRRSCSDCDFRFTTIEEVVLVDVNIVKRDGRTESYSREKLEKGLRKALEKREYSEEQLKKMISHIEVDIQRNKKNIQAIDIGELVMKYLRDFDTIAYIRFASVYRQFEDLEHFQDELNSFLSKKIKK